MAQLPYQVKVVFVGNAGVGKTSIIATFTDIMYESQYIPTIGVDYRQKIVTLKDGKRVKLQMWDTAGQERFRSLTINYYRGADIVLLVYDITNKKSFADLKEWKTSVVSQNPDTRFWVVGNKVDRDTQREISQEEAKEWAESIGAPWSEISARQSRDLEPLFYQIGENSLKTSESISTARMPILKLTMSKQSQESSFFSKYC